MTNLPTLGKVGLVFAPTGAVHNIPHTVMLQEVAGIGTRMREEGPARLYTKAGYR